MALIDPPPNWNFNHFLTDFCRKLRENDLVEIKVLFKGIVNEDVRTWMEMVDILLNKGYLSQYNIVYLQKIVYHLERPDLLCLLIEYAAASKNGILHFEHCQIQTRQECIRIHVRGYRYQTHGDINRTRRAISEILLVEIHNVIFAGIKEANSVLVTFMLPTMYVEVLKKLLESEKKASFMAPLSRQGIDQIYIREIIYQIDTKEQGEPNDEGKMILQLQLQVAQQEEQIKLMEKELLVHKRSESKASYLDDQSNESQGTEKKRKYLPDTEEPSKKLKSDDDFGPSSLSQHEKPESERYIILKPDVNPLYRKMDQYAGMSMTFRKMIYEVPEQLKKKRNVPEMTPEQINSLSLYAKLNRIYPPVPIQSK